MARMRALETGRYLIRATNNGISGIIMPTGQVLVKAPQFERTVITQNVPSMTGQTPLMYYGHYTVLCILLLLLCVYLIVNRKRVIKHVY